MIVASMAMVRIYQKNYMTIKMIRIIMFVITVILILVLVIRMTRVTIVIILSRCLRLCLNDANNYVENNTKHGIEASNIP